MLVQENRTNELNQTFFKYLVEVESKELDPSEPYPVPLSTDQFIFYTKNPNPDKYQVEVAAYQAGYWPQEWEVSEWLYLPENGCGDQEF
ncbi:hypothetical protein [Crocosphaera sp.]|uniref:hypothetical protein n=1 Tax=Crocosphaera sp. TaxID=2729996 RepID=UPI00261F27D0|nr:hypothetical protein [Crocosphaera sp.]MDJ0579035.1 hypothetical protein [Crocosphaera sp.]